MTSLNLVENINTFRTLFINKNKFDDLYHDLWQRTGPRQKDLHFTAKMLDQQIKDRPTTMWNECTVCRRSNLSRIWSWTAVAPKAGFVLKLVIVMLHRFETLLGRELDGTECDKWANYLFELACLIKQATSKTVREEQHVTDFFRYSSYWKIRIIYCERNLSFRLFMWL